MLHSYCLLSGIYDETIEVFTESWLLLPPVRRFHPSTPTSFSSLKLLIGLGQDIHHLLFHYTPDISPVVPRGKPPSDDSGWSPRLPKNETHIVNVFPQWIAIVSLWSETLRLYSLCCWSPWRGCYTWRRRPPHVRSPWPRCWRRTRSETSRTRSTAPRSCAPAQCLHTHKEDKQRTPVYSTFFLLKVIAIVHFKSPFDT